MIQLKRGDERMAVAISLKHHEKLQELAKSNYRSIRGQVHYLIDKEYDSIIKKNDT